MAVNISAARTALSFIELRQLSLHLPDGRQLLSAACHSFGPGLTGMVGANGSGKSLLLRTIAGLNAADAGGVAVAGSLHHVAQSRSACGPASVADIAGLGPLLAASARLSAGAASDGDFELLDGRWTVLDGFASALQTCGLGGLSPADSTAGLSGGEMTRIALAGAFVSGADWLLLDEPSNHLDRSGREWLIANLRAWTGSALIVSHDRELLESMDAIVELAGQRLRAYGGNYTLYQYQRNAQQSAAVAALAHVRSERRNVLREQRERHDALQSRAARNNRAGQEANMPAIVRGKLKSSAQAAAGRETLRRAETRTTLDAAVRDAAARVQTPAEIALLMHDTAVPAGRRVLAFDSAVPPWPAPAGQPDGMALDLVLAGPIRLAISGPNGCGKSTLLRMLAGEVAPRAGSAEALVPFAWLDQHAPVPRAGQTVLQALHELETPLAEGALRSRLALLGLGAPQINTPGSNLSGGERMKTALACALWRKHPAQLLLLDEPTNHLDLPSIEGLEQALQSYPGALAIVSHDKRFLAALNPTHELRWTPPAWRLTER